MKNVQPKCSCCHIRHTFVATMYQLSPQFREVGCKSYSLILLHISFCKKYLSPHLNCLLAHVATRLHNVALNIKKWIVKFLHCSFSQSVLKHTFFFIFSNKTTSHIFTLFSLLILGQYAKETFPLFQNLHHSGSVCILLTII